MRESVLNRRNAGELALVRRQLLCDLKDADIKLCTGVLIYSITEQLGTRRKKKCNKVMFTTGTFPRFADDGSCQHHLEHALQVQYESAQSFV
jgi:hypothetical protein